MFKASNSVRLFFLNVTILLMIGIWLSGFEKVHWFMYAVPAFLLFAAITGFCPGMMISKKILGTLGIKE
jgi:asparagine N-glycosylation enzyme membrane subunit Stt3